MACHSVMLKLELIGGLYCVGRNYVRFCGFGSMDTWYVYIPIVFLHGKLPKVGRRPNTTVEHLVYRTLIFIFVTAVALNNVQFSI